MLCAAVVSSVKRTKSDVDRVAVMSLKRTSSPESPGTISSFASCSPANAVPAALKTVAGSNVSMVLTVSVALASTSPCPSRPRSVTVPLLPEFGVELTVPSSMIVSTSVNGPAAYPGDRDGIAANSGDTAAGGKILPSKLSPPMLLKREIATVRAVESSAPRSSESTPNVSVTGVPTAEGRRRRHGCRACRWPGSRIGRRARQSAGAVGIGRRAQAGFEHRGRRPLR